MEIPAFQSDGNLPPGIHAATLSEVEARFGGTAARERQLGLLRGVLEAAAHYPTVKRILLWGSFVSAKAEPRDLDFSVVASVTHRAAMIRPEHRRFLSPFEARLQYGLDKKHLVIRDYPLELYLEELDFFTSLRGGGDRGIVELSMWGEFTGGG